MNFDPHSSIVKSVIHGPLSGEVSLCFKLMSECVLIRLINTVFNLQQEDSFVGDRYLPPKEVNVYHTDLKYW